MTEPRDRTPYGAVYDLSTDLRVRVLTDHSDLLVHLDEFFPRSSQPPTGWTIEARLSQPEPGMKVNPWGAGHHADPDRRLLRRASADSRSLLAGTRIAIREMLVDHWEQRRYTMLHASAIRRDDLLIVIVGDERAGKTTLMLRALLEQDFTFVANDHLVVHRDGDALAVTELPDVVSVRTTTFWQMRDLLPSPYDPNGIDVDTLRSATRPFDGEEGLMYYSPRSLGQPRRTEVLCGPGEPTRVVIVSASFAPEGGTPRAPQAVTDGAELLMPHVRADWVADKLRNVHELPRGERSLTDFVKDSASTTAKLADQAEVFHWEHNGDVEPLLALLREGER